MISIAELLQLKSITKPVSFTLAGFEFELMALVGDVKELTENAPSTFERHKLAAIYGLSTSGIRAVEYKNLTNEMVFSVFSEKDMPDDAITTIAEQVLAMSEMDLLHSDDITTFESDEIEEFEEEEEISEDSIIR